MLDGAVNISPDSEIDLFKRNINLTEYASTCGFELEKLTSSRSSVVMRHANGDKVIIARDLDNHWIYFSVRDASDNGSIIDFIQRRKGVSLGEVRKELRGWLSLFNLPTRPPARLYVADLEPVKRDFVAVRARWEAAGAIDGHHAYLEKVRRIPAALLASERFADRVRVDSHGNAVFPHWNRDGLCGFELKNDSFTGFAPGGVKGLWGSRKKSDDQQLIIAETAVDALSYAALFGFERSRFLSIAGSMNDEQPKLLAQAIELLPAGGIVVAAVDNDPGGDEILARLRREIHHEIIEDRPEERGQDWNDVLRQRA